MNENGPAPRCEWCNHKAPGHDALCKEATSADRLRGVRIPGHEERQHEAAYGGGADPGAELKAPPCDACGTFHGYGSCPTNYRKPLVDSSCPNCGIPGGGHQRWCPRLVDTDAAIASIVSDVILEDMLRARFGLSDDYQERKATPIATGVIDYFPDALAEVARASLAGNKQHGIEVLRWDRSKSSDEADALLRHFIQRGTVDSDGVLHSAKVAWRALALLQKEIEAMREGPAQV